jgi:hypothetical protein
MTCINNTNNSGNEIYDKKGRNQLVFDGVDLLLSIFGLVDQQKLFPRAIMTKFTRGQIDVNSKNEMMDWFVRAKISRL